jgi:hypothetical protein
MVGGRGRRRGRGVLVALSVLSTVLITVPLATAAPAPPAAVPVPAPTLSVPPAGLRGFGLWDSYSDLRPLGYEEQEYLVSGTAVDGAGAAAPYTTRIIVTRPSDPKRFNGTVLLDWVNVTAQFENAVDTLEARPMLLREGYAFVAVSAQAAGLCCVPLLTPKVWDPIRYASISHPGDAWSFDMFSQVAQAFRHPRGVGSLDPMGRLGARSVRHVLAAGQSQSALELRQYVDSWLPGHTSALGLIDGFLIHGDVGAAKGFQARLPVKVLNLLGDFEARNDGFDPTKEDPSYRLWEVAGAGHSDQFIGYQSVFGHGPRVLLGLPKQNRSTYAHTLRVAGSYGEIVEPELLVCAVAGSAMPMRYVVSSALHQLDRWVAGGKAPDNGPRFRFVGGQQEHDAHGNPTGGIRLPPIEVPVATYVSTLCALGGITVPFTDLQLQQLYGSHAQYLRKMSVATDRAVAKGWILPDDALDLMARACGARVRFPDANDRCPTYRPPAYDTPLVPALRR